MEIDQLLRDLSNHSVWLPLIAATFVLSKKGLPKELKLIFCLVVLSMLSDIVSVYLAKRFQNNMPWLHFYQLAEALILIIFFNSLFKSNKIWTVVSVLLLAFLIINSTIIGAITSFNTRGTSTSAIFFIVSSLIYFYRIYSEERLLELEKTPHFWIVTGILIYYSGAFFTFLSYETFKTWIFHNFANTLKNGMFCIGFLLQLTKDGLQPPK